MGTFKIVTKKELRARKKMGQEELTLFEQFKVYLAKLDGNDAGIYEFSKEEDHERPRKMLRMAASALGIKIRVKEENNSLVFYRRVRRGEKK